MTQIRAGVICVMGAALAAPVSFSQSLRELSKSFEGLAEHVRPAVVQIFATSYATPSTTEATNAASLLSPQRSTASGVIVSADGYIVTNNHVVQGARKLEVRLASMHRQEGRNSTLLATVVGTDRDTDVAVLKIDGTNLTYLELGDSDKLKQGQIVIAFGNPLGLQGSMTTGIV